MRMRGVMCPGGRGVIRNHILGISDPNLPIHYITFMGLQRRLRGVYVGAPPMFNILRLFTFLQNFSILIQLNFYNNVLKVMILSSQFL